jgi:hypothetical protein
MSQRIGMADGRCLTFNDSNRIMTENMMKNLGLSSTDNSQFRGLLQERGPEMMGFADDRKCLRPWELAQSE